MLRKLAIAALAAGSLLAASPVYAGTAENTYLKQLANSWSGNGKLSGADSGTISCRVVLTAGSANLKYQGRCNVTDMGAQAFNGAIAYNDKAKRYEIRSSAGTVAGVKRGNKLVFTTTSKSIAGTAYTTMTMSPSQFVLDFAMVDGKTKEKTTSRIVFGK